MLIKEALAQTASTAAAGANGGGDLWSFAIQFALIILVLYLLLIRPQQKRIRNHEMALKAIIKGTKVIVSGIEGVVVEVVDDERLRVQIADGVVIDVIRAYVSQVVFPQESAPKKSNKKEK